MRDLTVERGWVAASSGASEQNVRRTCVMRSVAHRLLQVERHFTEVYGVLAHGCTVPGS